MLKYHNIAKFWRNTVLCYRKLLPLQPFTKQLFIYDL